MQDGDQRYLNNALQLCREYLLNEIKSVEQQLGQQLQAVAENKIAAIKESLEDSLKKAQGQYEAEMARAGQYANIPMLSNQIRDSAKRQLDIAIRGYRGVAAAAIKNIRELTR